MCSDPDSRPPIEPRPDVQVDGWHTRLSATDGASFSAFRADGPDATGRGIIVLPDYYGLSPFYEALALRFAEVGVDAIAVDYYGRTAPPPPRGADFDHVAHAGRTTWAGLQADIAAAAHELRTQRAVEQLWTIGFCFGGRTSMLLSTLPELQLSGVIGFYGWPVRPIANDTPAPAQVTTAMQAPVLAIFGGADSKISGADVSTFETALERAPASTRVSTYDGAPHSFFDRAYAGHREPALAAWKEIRDFIDATAGR